MRLRAVAAGALDAVDDLRGRLQVQVVEAVGEIAGRSSLAVATLVVAAESNFLGEDYTALHFLSCVQASPVTERT